MRYPAASEGSLTGYTFPVCLVELCISNQVAPAPSFVFSMPLLTSTLNSLVFFLFVGVRRKLRRGKRFAFPPALLDAVLFPAQPLWRTSPYNRVKKIHRAQVFHNAFLYPQCVIPAQPSLAGCLANQATRALQGAPSLRLTRVQRLVLCLMQDVQARLQTAFT